MNGADKLIRATVTITNRQARFGRKKAGNLSRYIRTLIDQDIGREEGSLLSKNKNRQQC